jgi:hypothetical protein
MNVPASFVVLLLICGLFPTGQCAAPPISAAVPDPSELLSLRGAYETRLAPSQQKLEEALKTRMQRYAADLQAAEQQVTESGKLDALPSLQGERNAYTAGHGSAGFPEDDRKVPTSAKELRRAYDHDAAKIRGDLGAAARPVVESYVRQLGDLESKFVSARNPEGVLAVRKEKQAIQEALNDPLYGGDTAVLGSWFEPSGTKVDFHPDGTVKDGTGASGTWAWENRGQRKIVISWQNNRGKVPYALSPDGGGMFGRNKKGEHVAMSRK